MNTVMISLKETCRFWMNYYLWSDYSSLTCVHTCWKLMPIKKSTELPHNLQNFATFSLVPMVFLTFFKHLVQKLNDDFHFPFLLDGHLPREKKVVHRKLMVPVLWLKPWGQAVDYLFGDINSKFPDINSWWISRNIFYHLLKRHNHKIHKTTWPLHIFFSKKFYFHQFAKTSYSRSLFPPRLKTFYFVLVCSQLTMLW